MTATHSSKKDKPLLVIEKPVKASVYRASFKPFKITRLLDPDKVKKARKMLIEVGTIEAAGRSATLIARIDKGMVTELTVEGCVGCDRKPKGRVGKKEKKVLAIVNGKADTIGGVTSLPIPFGRVSDDDGGGDIYIPIWPFPPIVIIFEPSTWCIAIRVGDTICYYCPGVGANCI